ncbi:MAG: SUMF1/EgtB/PvdO family nonheme iron enzyme, partial [Proteobacteria bacterium]|nr:SUMF1/EgtB/PvdO family nonheme iron enzyme [Pseudomonadota bacterium]
CPDCPEMVEIPAGFYLMGSPLFEWDRYRQIFSPRDWRTRIESANREGPRRLVHIARPFALSRYEITFAQWDAAQDDPAWADATELYPRKPVLTGVTGYQNRAVTMVNQFDARGFARWMSRHTGRPYRIPTEAEWEYAARAGTVTARPWGNAIGWNNATCMGCGDRWPEKRIGPVGLYAPNGFGLYDMIGNGREWVRDCFASYVAASITDGSAWVRPGCVFGVAKGESAYAEAWRNRSAYRVGPHLHNALEGGTIRLLREMD